MLWKDHYGDRVWNASVSSCGTRWEAGAIVQVRDDYRAARRPVISQVDGNWAF